MPAPAAGRYPAGVTHCPDAARSAAAYAWAPILLEALSDMTAPLLIRNVTLPDGRSGQDLLALDGRIAGVGPALAAPAGVPVLEGRGLLLAPPFVDAHFHLDATLSGGLPRVNQSGTLLEGIALWGELKPLLTQDALVERALQYCDWAVAQGPARDPLARGRLRRRGCLPWRRCCRCASASSPSSTCSSSPSRRTACCARPTRWPT